MYATKKACVPRGLVCDNCGSRKIQATDDETQLKCMDCHMALAADAINATLDDHFQPQTKVPRIRATAKPSTMPNVTEDNMSLTEASMATSKARESGQRKLKLKFQASDDDSSVDKSDDSDDSDGH